MFGPAIHEDVSASHVPFLPLIPGEPVRVLALTAFESIWIHFEGRSRLCPGSDVCRLCSIGRPARSLHFFGCLSNKKRYLLRVTSQAANRISSTPPNSGRLFLVESIGTRKPLVLVSDGFASVPAGEEMTRIDLLKVLMSIHGLGLPNGGETVAQLIDLARTRAIKVIERESLL